MDDRSRLDRLYRDCAPRLLGMLVARCQAFDRAEDALADAFAAAHRTWPEQGWPEQPEAWLFRVAVHADRDRRKHAAIAARSADWVAEALVVPGDEAGAIAPDQRLAMFFLCAHPSLGTDTQALLMLRYCALVPTADIARAFLMDADTTTRRLHRAKAKLEQAGVSFDTPDRADWPNRLPPVLAALEVLYDQSWADIGGGREAEALARDALHLAGTLVTLMPDEPEVLGLAALLHFCESRRAARINPEGRMVPLDDQDTSLWSPALIAIGADLLYRASKLRRPGPWQWRAAIHAAHARRKVLGHTPWPEVLQAYRCLESLDDGPMLQINLALAEARAGNLGAARERFARIDRAPLQHHRGFLLAEAELAWMQGDAGRALAALAHAEVLPGGSAETAFIADKRTAWAEAAGIRQQKAPHGAGLPVSDRDPTAQ